MWEQRYRVYNSTRKQWLPFVARLAATERERYLGYQFQLSHNNSDAILFVFSRPGYHPMHMRNVFFPIAMSWLDSHHITVDRFIAKPDPRMLYTPRAPASLCLEYPISWVNTIQNGDKLEFIRLSL